MSTPVVPADPALVAASENVLKLLPTATSEGAGTGERGTFEVRDPADGSLLAAVADMGPTQALEAITRADAAGAAWAATTTRQRSDALMAWHSAITEHAEEIALLICREMGKPLAEARAEVAYGADFVHWYAGEALRPGGNVRDAPAGGARIFTRRAPVGLSVLITPWNFPLAMATRKIAPALAAGCPVVLKPAALTPLTSLLVAELAVGAGVPDGLIEVVTTTSASAFSTSVLADPRVRKVSFTGSTEVGKILLRLAADQVLKTSMELGGNAPFLVFDDADLERAVAGAVAAKLRNGGQSCIAANRFLVQDGIADAFVEALGERLSQLQVGSGLGPGVALGPVIDPGAQQRLTGLVDDAVERGACVVTGGAAIDHPGSFVPATVLDHVPHDAAVHHTEIFGPIASITRFSTQAEALQRANDTEFGLASYVFTENLDRAFNVADALSTGMVGINQGVPSNAAAPFGGVKQSGLGREGSGEGLEDYQEIRFYNLARRATA